MAYREEETTRLKRQSSRQAISLAMEGRWQEAVAANQSIIASFPDDVDAYNRLGRAYLELGEYGLARGAYEKSLSHDPYNTIAKKNIDRLSKLGGDGAKPVKATLGQDGVAPHQFIEEVAKAGVVDLRRLAAPDVLAKTVAGSRANLKVDGQRLLVENNRGEYVGQVEPKHASRLIKLMNGGNKYSANIVNADEDVVNVIIREEYQHPNLVGQPSFPSRSPEGSKLDVVERIGDRLLRRTLENLDEDGSTQRETGYSIVGGDDGEVEVLSEDVEEEEEEEIDSDD